MASIAAGPGAVGWRRSTAPAAQRPGWVPSGRTAAGPACRPPLGAAAAGRRGRASPPDPRRCSCRRRRGGRRQPRAGDTLGATDRKLIELLQELSELRPDDRAEERAKDNRDQHRIGDLHRTARPGDSQRLLDQPAARRRNFSAVSSPAAKAQRVTPAATQSRRDAGNIQQRGYQQPEWASPRVHCSQLRERERRRMCVWRAFASIAPPARASLSQRHRSALETHRTALRMNTWLVWFWTKMSRNVGAGGR